MGPGGMEGPRHLGVKLVTVTESMHLNPSLCPQMFLPQELCSVLCVCSYLGPALRTITLSPALRVPLTVIKVTLSYGEVSADSWMAGLKGLDSRI